MAIYFSESTLSFYPADLQNEYNDAGSMPNDLVEISEDEERIYFCQSAPNGKKIGSDNGRPVWIELPEKTTDELIVEAQSKILTFLASASDKIAPLQDAVDLGIATTEETTSLTAWKTYRVAVNRVPTQSGFPTTIDWPAMPS